MALPELILPVTRAVAKVLRTRARQVAALGEDFVSVDAEIALDPPAPYVAVEGDFDIVPFTTITPTVTGLPAGDYVARSATPGQAEQPWSAPTASDGTAPTAFPPIAVLVGPQATIAVSPVGLEDAIAWITPPFDVGPAMGLSSQQVALDFTLFMTLNSPDAASVSVDWGDGTPAQVDAASVWTAPAGVLYAYAAPGTYIIQCTATTAIAGPAGVSALTATVEAAAFALVAHPSEAFRVTGKITASPALTWDSALISWGDGGGEVVTKRQAQRLSHTYSTSGVYLVSATFDSGLTIRGFAVALGGPEMANPFGAEDAGEPAEAPEPEPEPEPEAPPAPKAKGKSKSKSDTGVK